MARARRVELAGEEGSALFFQLDGELREPRSNWLRVELRPAALRVIGGRSGGGR
jgi:hypothetical protein